MVLRPLWRGCWSQMSEKIQAYSCSFCELASVVMKKPWEMTINDLIAIEKHMRKEHNWIPEWEFVRKWK